jgi:hypothetical protein
LPISPVPPITTIFMVNLLFCTDPAGTPCAQAGGPGNVDCPEFHRLLRAIPG